MHLFSKLAIILSLAGTVAAHAQKLGPPTIIPSATGQAATGQIPGTTTNDSASSGNVGEYVSSSIPIGSAVSVTNNVAANVTSISLTAGDWDVWGQVNSNITASAQITLTESYVTTTSATRATPPNGGAYVFDQQAKTASTNVSYPVGMTRLSLSGTTTVYLGVFSLFNTSTNAYYGFIGARRVR